MDIRTNPTTGNIECYSSGAKVPSLTLPGRMMTDMRAVAALDEIRCNSDKWLIGEVCYCGEKLRGDDVCYNCGGTGGFLAPTGEKRASRMSCRSDGALSPFMRKLVMYPCPVCKDTNALALNQLSKVWLDDPQAVIDAAADLWWEYAGREAMSDAVKRAIARYTAGDTTGTLTLVGPYGCGKSTFAAEIVRACTVANITALYVSTDRFKRAVQDSIGMDGTNPDLDRIQNTPVVVFDQIDWIRETGAGGGTTFVAEKARDIFNARYNMRRSRATVYVVNTAAWNDAGNDALAALYDRMKDGEVAQCDLSGLRERIGQARQASFED